MRVFTGNKVLLPNQDEPQPATIVVDTATGRITDVLTRMCTRDGFSGVQGQNIDWIDAGNNVILPGIVDAHVHLNEPGRTDWEGFFTGTRAAASGGVTTLVDMPLNSIPPTTTVNNLEKKRAAAHGQCYTDVAFWGGVIPGNQADLKPLVAAGVRGFKCFLIESGVEEFPCVGEKDLETAMRELEGTSTVLCFHAELETIPAQPASSEQHDPTLYSTFLSSRSQQLEMDAIKLILEMHTRYPSLRLHIVHLSASSAVPLIRAAKASGLPLTVETCFHYLALSSEHIPRGRPEFKCCPPIRDTENREALWEALKEGTIDCVVSDHSPCVAELKKCDEGDIMSAWGGISTLGLGLSLLWTEGRKHGVHLGQIVDWLCVKTARHAGLDDKKGMITIGYDADLIIWNPEATFQVTKESLNFKNKLTPYEGLTLTGQVQKTFLRGSLVYDHQDGFVQGNAPGILI